MKISNGGIVVAGLAMGMSTTAMAQIGGPVAQGDIAFGLSRSSGADTAELVRNGTLQGNWTFTTYLQSMEFDNLGGNSHNAGSNLLSLNFGTTGGGGSLWSLATDGSDAGSQLYAFDGTNEGLTRIGGLSVSPDNTKIAAIGYDTGSLILLDYTAGNGTGNGSAAFLDEETFFAATGATQGTAWMDNDTVIAALLGFVIGDLDIVTYDVNTGAIDTVATISGLQSGSEFTDIDYNPDVSPYVCVNYSSFSGATENTVVILDPSDWSVVNRVDMSTSANTSRENALGFHNDAPALFFSQYSGAIDVLDLTDPGSLADNSSVDYYVSSIAASFNGIDYAVSGTGGPSDCLTLTVDNLVAGDRATFTITDGTPGARAVTVYGFQAGTTKVNDVFGYCATFGIKGVSQSKVVGGLNRSFDANGEISFRQPIPTNARGRTVFFQSAQQGTCPDECMSNLVRQTVQ